MPNLFGGGEERDVRVNAAMERRHFKLEKGYLNVDTEAITFTRSGNWAEAAAAPERSARVSVGHAVRMILGIALVITGMAFYAMKGLNSGGEIAFLVATAGAGFGLYKFGNALRDDFARAFRIPYAKVRSMYLDDDGLVIAFIDGRWKEDEVKVHLPEADATWIQTMWKSRNER
jgi:hypothetical protein